MAASMVSALEGWPVRLMRRVFNEGIHENWEPILDEIERRAQSYRTALTNYPGLDRDGKGHLLAKLQPKSSKKGGAAFHASMLIPAAPELVAVDLFVEKAQLHLTRSALLCYGAAIVSFLFLILSLLGAYCYITTHSVEVFLQNLAAIYGTRSPDTATWPIVLMRMANGAAVAAVFSSAVYIFTILTRAFAHEGTVLFNRRHALRFGRLFVYLKLSGLPSAQEVTIARRLLSLSDLDQAFGWNIESNTAFKEISPRDATFQWNQKIIGIVERLAEKGAEQHIGEGNKRQRSR